MPKSCRVFIYFVLSLLSCLNLFERLACLPLISSWKTNFFRKNGFTFFPYNTPLRGPSLILWLNFTHFTCKGGIIYISCADLSKNDVGELLVPITYRLCAHFSSSFRRGDRFVPRFRICPTFLRFTYKHQHDSFEMEMPCFRIPFWVLWAELTKWKGFGAGAG